MSPLCRAQMFFLLAGFTVPLLPLERSLLENAAQKCSTSWVEPVSMSLPVKIKRYQYQSSLVPSARTPAKDHLPMIRPDMCGKINWCLVGTPKNSATPLASTEDSNKFISSNFSEGRMHRKLAASSNESSENLQGDCNGHPTCPKVSRWEFAQPFAGRNVKTIFDFGDAA